MLDAKTLKEYNVYSPLRRERIVLLRKYLHACILVVIALLTILLVPPALAGISDVSAPSGKISIYQTFPLTLNFTATLSGSSPRSAVVSSNIPENWTYLDYEATLDGLPVTFIETAEAASVSWENETMGEGTMILLAHFKAPYDLRNYTFTGGYAYWAGGALNIDFWNMEAQVLEFPSGVDVNPDLPPDKITTPPNKPVPVSFEANLTGLKCRAAVSCLMPENCSYLGYEAYVNSTPVTFNKTFVDDSVTLENSSLGYLDPLCGNVWAWNANLRLTLLLNFTERGIYNVTGLYVFAGGNVIKATEWNTTVHVEVISIEYISIPSKEYGSLIPIEFLVSSPGMAHPNTTVRISIEFEGTLVWERNATFDFPAGNTTLMTNYTLIADYTYEEGWDTLDLWPSNASFPYKDGGNITVTVQLISPEGDVLAEITGQSTLLPCTRECLWDRIVDIILGWPTASPEQRESMWNDIVRIILLWPTVPEGK